MKKREFWVQFLCFYLNSLLMSMQPSNPSIFMVLSIYLISPCTLCPTITCSGSFNNHKKNSLNSSSFSNCIKSTIYTAKVVASCIIATPACSYLVDVHRYQASKPIYFCLCNTYTICLNYGLDVLLMKWMLCQDMLQSWNVMYWGFLLCQSMGRICQVQAKESSLQRGFYVSYFWVVLGKLFRNFMDYTISLPNYYYFYEQYHSMKILLNDILSSKINH